MAPNCFQEATRGTPSRGDMIDQGGVKGAPGSFQAAIVYWVAPHNAFNGDFAQEATRKGGILQRAT